MKMEWEKRGLIFENRQQHPWMVSHACVPTALHMPDQGLIRIYFAPRNSKGQSIPTFIDVRADDPGELIQLHDRPILELGRLGTFDDGGIMPCSVVRNEETIYLYYVGWNPTVSVPYRNAIGLAISEDGGTTFHRACEGPVIGRNQQEPFFTASPCMRFEDGIWKAWYASGTGFVEVAGKPEPLYIIKYATSKDGIYWNRPNITAIYPKDPYEANARPSVHKDEDGYKMWFCYRGSFDFRDGKDAYRIGYAESDNGRDWTRKDEEAGIRYSESGWDATMQTYPNVLELRDRHYLFYNGNGFGRTGIGYAVNMKN